MQGNINQIKNEINVVLFTCDQKLTKSQFSRTHATNKKDNGKKIRWAVQNPLRQSGWSQVGSPVGERGSYGGKNLYSFEKKQSFDWTMEQ